MNDKEFENFVASDKRWLDGSWQYERVGPTPGSFRAAQEAGLPGVARPDTGEPIPRNQRSPLQEAPIPRPNPRIRDRADVAPTGPPPRGATGLARAAEHIMQSRGVIGEQARGEAVAEIQRFLNAQRITGASGERLPINGIFDRTTRAAVETYQARRPTLLADGIVGRLTLAAMLRDEDSASPANKAGRTIVGEALNNRRRRQTVPLATT